MIGSFLPGLLRISLFGSLAAILLLLLRPVLGSMVSQSVVYYLWLLVLLRLCVPVGVTVTLPSTSDTVTHRSNRNVSQDIGNGSAPTKNKGTAIVEKMDKPAKEADVPQGPLPRNSLDAQALCLILWGFGMLACLGWHIWTSLRFSRGMRRSLSEADPAVVALLREMEPTGGICLAESPMVDTPMLLGLLHPIIVLPKGASHIEAMPESDFDKAAIPESDFDKAAIPESDFDKAAIPESDFDKAAIPESDFDKAAIPESDFDKAAIPESDLTKGAMSGNGFPEEARLHDGIKKGMLEDIIMHELTHAKRHDLLYKWFAIMVASLHWFNPLMFLIRREIDRCCELSCDEAVIRDMDADSRRHYGETLLAMAGAPSAGSGPLTATLCDEKAQLKERLLSIGKYRKKGIPAALLSALLALLVGGCAMVSDTKTGGTDSAQAKAPTVPMENKETQNVVWESAEGHYLAVLTGKKQFLYYADDAPHYADNDYVDDADAAQPMGIADIPGIFSPDSSYAKIDRFAVIDLDGDGEREVLLQVIDVGSDGGGYMVLRCEGEEVHGYTAYYKDFTALKTDGTFLYCPVPAKPDDGIGTVHFYKNGYSILALASSETSEDFKTVTYQIGQETVSEEEYLAAKEQHYAKTDAVWHEFTDENISQQEPGQADGPQEGTGVSGNGESVQADGPQGGTGVSGNGESVQADGSQEQAGLSEEDKGNSDEGIDLYYEKDGEQYGLVKDLVTGEYLWASILSEGKQVEDSHGHKSIDDYSQERRFERLDGKESYPVRRWDNLLYSAGEYLIFEYDSTIHVSKSTDLYHPVLSYGHGATYGIVTKVPQGYMVADERSYEIRFYDEKFAQTLVKTGLRAGENGHYYEDGLMAVRDMETGLTGFLDEEGQLVVPCVYAAASDFSNGFASVLVDAEVVPYTEDGGAVQMFHGKGGQWGIIDREGRFVVKPSQKYANESPDEPVWYPMPGVRYFGPVREDGTVDFIAVGHDGQNDRIDRVLETILVR